VISQYGDDDVNLLEDTNFWNYPYHKLLLENHSHL